MSTRTTSTTKASALDFHNRLIEQRGVDKATGFSSHGRYARFSVIARCLEQFPNPSLKLLDYGCNNGELFDVLRTGLGPVYIGVDINPKFIALACERWKDYINGGRMRLLCGNALDNITFNRMRRMSPDVVVASGVLCYTVGADTYPELVNRLFTCARQALIFNVLVNTKPKNKDIYVWNKGRVLRLVDACGCRSWEIIRSYLANDMTVVMCKELTHAEYEVLNKKQNGVCAICGKPEQRKKKRLHVDHRHRTGKIRGLLCGNCNTGIGKLGEDVRVLEAAIQYIESGDAR